MNMQFETDLTYEVFLVLREYFYDNAGKPRVFSLREKQNTQDDPLDEHIAAILSENLNDAICQKASGPLISPDFVVYRPYLCTNTPREVLRGDLSRIVGIEVKKLERSVGGQIARSSGLDYNTTPPCGIVRIYDANETSLDIRGFYLFVCQESVAETEFILNAMVLCDGNMINEDFDLYLEITSQRTKEIGLGTFGDGVNRNRPMLIFTNPLGASELDHAATLIKSAKLSDEHQGVGQVFTIERSLPDNSSRQFFAYRATRDIPTDWHTRHLINPFPQPQKRVTATQSRGKFRLPIKPRN